MKNPAYFIQRCRDLLDEYEPSTEKVLAELSLNEFELWIKNCKPTQEALERDGSSQQ